MACEPKFGSLNVSRYFEVFGIGELVVLDDYLDEAARSEAAAQARRILEINPSAADLKALIFHGASIGRHVLSTLSRALRLL